MTDSYEWTVPLAKKLKRRLVFFDLETTGTDPLNDKIVEISLFIIYPFGTGDPSSQTLRFNPGMEIAPDATAAHGITNEDVKDEPDFKLFASTLDHLLESADLAGYNIRHFDLPLLQAEMNRAGYYIDLPGRNIIDVMFIYHKYNPRTLSAAFRHYMYEDLEDAHSAEADTLATARVFAAQREDHPDIGAASMAEIHEWCDAYEAYSWFKGETVETMKFQKGKHKGLLLMEVARTNPGYLFWMRDKAESMPEAVKRIVDRALKTRK